MERGPPSLGPRFHFSTLYPSFLSCTYLFRPKSLNQILWRRIEKDARNLLMKKDERKSGITEQPETLQFSTVLTKRRWGISTTSEGGETVWRGFHRFTRIITTTRF